MKTKIVKKNNIKRLKIVGKILKYQPKLPSPLDRDRERDIEVSINRKFDKR